MYEFKLHSNRRLYCKTTKSYMSPLQVWNLLKDGSDVIIVQRKDDVTEDILLKLLCEFGSVDKETLLDLIRQPDDIPDVAFLSPEVVTNIDEEDDVDEEEEED